MARKGLQLEALVVPIVPDIARYQKELKKIHGITVKVGRANEAAIKKYFVNPLNMVGKAARQNFAIVGKSAASAGTKIQQSGQMATQSLKAMSAAMRSSAQNAKRLQAQVDALSRRLRALERQAKKTGKAVQSSGINRKNRGGLMEGGFAMGMAGVGLTAGVTAPLVGAAGFGAKQMIEFESSFAGVLKTVNGSERQLGELRQGFRDMAQEIPLGVNELNKIGEAAGQLGIRTESILGFTEVMAKMGVTTNLSADEAATTLARFANITQMSQQDFGKLGSVIVHLGNQFATTESEIVNMGLRIAGAGAQVGMSEGQILALATASSSLGLEVEMGGTAISRLIIRMQAATSEAKGAETAFSKVAGMTGKAFEQMVKNNPAEAFRQFIDGLNRTKRAGGDVIGVLTEMGIDEVRLRDTILRLASGSGLLTKALQEQAEGWSQVDALTEEAEKRFATTESQLQLLWNAVVETGIQLGEALAPAIQTVMAVIRDFIPHVQQLVAYFQALPDWVQNTVLVIAALAAAVGPLLVGLSGLLITLGALQFAFTTLGISASSVMASLAALPIALIAVAGVAVAFAPLLYQIHSLNMELKESLYLTNKLNRVEDKRHQATLEKAREMAPQQAIQFLAQEKAMAEKDLFGRRNAVGAAREERDKFVQSVALPDGSVPLFKRPQLSMLDQNLQEARDAATRQEDWVAQIDQQRKSIQKMGATPGQAPGVMGAEGVADAAKTPLEKAREQLQRSQEMSAAMDQARAEAGLPPLHPEKPQGLEAVRAQMAEQQQQKAWREQVAQEMGIAKPPKLTGIAAQEEFLRNKMQREADREAAAGNLGIPPAPGPRVRGARGSSTGGENGIGSSILMRQQMMFRSPRRRPPPAAGAAIAKAKHRSSVAGKFGGIVRGSDTRRNFATGEDAIRHARLARQPGIGMPTQTVAGGGSYSASDFSAPRRQIARQQVKPMQEAVEEGTVAAKEKQREMVYDDSELGQLKRIADNTSGLKGKTIVVKETDLGGAI